MASRSIDVALTHKLSPGTLRAGCVHITTVAVVPGPFFVLINHLNEIERTFPHEGVYLSFPENQTALLKQNCVALQVEKVTLAK